MLRVPECCGVYNDIKEYISVSNITRHPPDKALCILQRFQFYDQFRSIHLFQSFTSTASFRETDNTSSSLILTDEDFQFYIKQKILVLSSSGPGLAAVCCWRQMLVKLRVLDVLTDLVYPRHRHHYCWSPSTD